MNLKIKKTLIWAGGILAVSAIIYSCLPYYARQALIHLMPKINDLEIFSKNTVQAEADSSYIWPKAYDYNTYSLEKEDEAYIDSLKTVSFLLIQNDSLVFESYRNGWNDTLTSNIYSATKSIVGLLTGIAVEEGKIGSIDDPVSKYIPTYTKGPQADVTIRNLLTMSASMGWDEAYSSLFSVTTHGYYGNDLYDLVANLPVEEKPGVNYSYRSGETQLLAFVVEAATGKTISEYAMEKLWTPMHAERNAYWLLDKENGDEKAFCCFHTIARDMARFGHLMLNDGKWMGTQVVPEWYMREATSPADYLIDEWGKDHLDYYGYQIWIMNYKGAKYPYMRGMLGQYMVAIPEHNAIFVRLGHKRSKVKLRDLPADLVRYMDIVMKMLDEREIQ